MNKKEIVVEIHFEDKVIRYPIDYETAKDRTIVEEIVKTLINQVDRYRSERISQYKIYKSVKK